MPGGVGALDAGGEGMARAKAMLESVGGSTMSWMTTWPAMRYLFTADGRGYIGYERHAGVALALADPVVPHPTIAAAVTEFATMAERGGLIPALFSVTDAAADAARAAGWRTVQIAEDTLIDLPGLEFKGKAWQDVRSALNKARKESIEFRIVTLAEEPFAILAQVRAISQEWVGDKELPEMGFTLGGVDEALDPKVRVGIAIDATGSLHGVTSWLPVYAEGGEVRGWTLDVMRRRTDGFRSVMEFMIASACLQFREQGAAFVSLSGAPLARGEVSPAELDRTDRLLRLIEAMIPRTGIGLPIGSLTSQIFANVYTGATLDRHLQQTLGERLWYRYMDDLVVLGRSPAHLRDLKVEIERYSRETLGLRFSKWSVAPASRGINFLGYRIWATHKLLRRDSVVRARRKIAAYRAAGDRKRLERFIGSWLGHASHADARNLIRSLGLEGRGS